MGQWAPSSAKVKRSPSSTRASMKRQARSTTLSADPALAVLPLAAKAAGAGLLTVAISIASIPFDFSPGWLGTGNGDRPLSDSCGGLANLLKDGITGRRQPLLRG